MCSSRSSCSAVSSVPVMNSILRRRARLRHARATFDRVVIGQRQRHQAGLAAARDHFLRGKRPVGKIRVQMEVGVTMSR